MTRLPGSCAFAEGLGSCHPYACVEVSRRDRAEPTPDPCPHSREPRDRTAAPLHEASCERHHIAAEGGIAERHESLLRHIDFISTALLQRMLFAWLIERGFTSLDDSDSCVLA